MPTWYVPKHIKSFFQAPDYLRSLDDENRAPFEEVEAPMIFPTDAKTVRAGHIYED
jgi:hypothetical protein